MFLKLPMVYFMKKMEGNEGELGMTCLFRLFCWRGSWYSLGIPGSWGIPSNDFS